MAEKGGNVLFIPRKQVRFPTRNSGGKNPQPAAAVMSSKTGQAQRLIVT